MKKKIVYEKKIIYEKNNFIKLNIIQNNNAIFLLLIFSQSNKKDKEKFLKEKQMIEKK